MEYPYNGLRRDLLGDDCGLDKDTILSNVSFKNLRKNIELYTFHNVALIMNSLTMASIRGSFDNRIFAYGKIVSVGKKGFFGDGGLYLQSIFNDDHKFENAPKLFIPYDSIIDMIAPEMGVKHSSQSGLYKMIFREPGLDFKNKSCIETYNHEPVSGLLQMRHQVLGEPMMLVYSERYESKKFQELIKPAYNHVEDIVAGTTVIYDRNGKILKNVA